MTQKQLFELNKEQELKKLNDRLRQCNNCSKMIQSRKEIMGKDNYPLVGFGKHNAIYFLIGIAPGRVKKKYKKENEEDQAFKYGSGIILKETLQQLNILDKVYITNLCKCNTPADNIFLNSDMKYCIDNFLLKEIKIINPKKIILLGTQANKYFNMFVKRKVNIDTKYIWHPSYISRGYSTKEKYLEKWREVLE